MTLRPLGAAIEENPDIAAAAYHVPEGCERETGLSGINTEQGRSVELMGLL